jgi:tripartite ATP-independent transporter DctM subunit
MTDTSVGKLFMAGFVPGFTLAALFMLVIAVSAMMWPEITGRKEDVPPLVERLRNLKELLPAVAVIFVVMGSIYTGWATPTEAAAVGVVMSLILVAAKGRLTMALLRDSALSAVNVTAMTLLILVAAFYLNFILGLIGVPELISSAVSGTGMSPWQVIFVLVILYLILGCFLDTMTMMIATIPIVFPVITHAGYDGIWAGIFIVVMCEIGLITPPVGMNLYVVQGVRGRGSIADVMRGIVPFLFCMLALVVLITIWPEIVMWLPNAVFG